MRARMYTNMLTGFKASLSFFTVMGVGWTFGILTMVDSATATASLVFQYDSSLHPYPSIDSLYCLS